MQIHTTINQGDLEQIKVGFWMRDVLGYIDADDLERPLPHFVLDHYIVYSRETKRHKFQIVRDKVWKRVNGRDNTLKLEDIVIPETAIAKAMAVMHSIKFEKE